MERCFLLIVVTALACSAASCKNMVQDNLAMGACPLSYLEPIYFTISTP